MLRRHHATNVSTAGFVWFRAQLQSLLSLHLIGPALLRGQRVPFNLKLILENCAARQFPAFNGRIIH